jgi:hypothetical protein
MINMYECFAKIKISCKLLQESADPVSPLLKPGKGFIRKNSISGDETALSFPLSELPVFPVKLIQPYPYTENPGLLILVPVPVGGYHECAVG